MDNTNTSEFIVEDEREEGLSEPPPPTDEASEENKTASKEENKPAAADTKPVDTRVEDPYTIEGCTISFTISYLPENDGIRQVAVSVRNGMDIPILRSFSSEDLPITSLPTQFRSLLQELEDTLPARQEENKKSNKKPMVYGPDPVYKAGKVAAKKPNPAATKTTEKTKPTPTAKKPVEKVKPNGPSLFDWTGN